MNHPEQALQMSVVEWLGLVAPKLVYFAVPNAIDMKGRDRFKALNKNKKMGVLPGVGDLCFLLSASEFWARSNVAFIELKAGRGKQTDNQIAFEKACKRLGIPYAICDSLEQVEGTLRGWGVALRAKVAA